MNCLDPDPYRCSVDYVFGSLCNVISSSNLEGCDDDTPLPTRVVPVRRTGIDPRDHVLRTVSLYFWRQGSGKPTSNFSRVQSQCTSDVTYKRGYKWTMETPLHRHVKLIWRFTSWVVPIMYECFHQTIIYIQYRIMLNDIKNGVIVLNFEDIKFFNIYTL